MSTSRQGWFSMSSAGLWSKLLVNWSRAAFVPTLRARSGFPIVGRTSLRWRARRTPRLSLAIQKFLIRRGGTFARAGRDAFCALGGSGNSGDFLTRGTEYAVEKEEGCGSCGIEPPNPNPVEDIPDTAHQRKQQSTWLPKDHVLPRKKARAIFPEQTARPHIKPVQQYG